MQPGDSFHLLEHSTRDRITAEYYCQAGTRLQDLPIRQDISSLDILLEMRSALFCTVTLQHPIYIIQQEISLHITPISIAFLQIRREYHSFIPQTLNVCCQHITKAMLLACNQHTKLSSLSYTHVITLLRCKDHS